MLEIKNTSRNYQDKEEKAGQDINKKQLHAKKYRSTLISEEQEGKMILGELHRSTCGLCQISGVHHPLNDPPERNKMCFC